MNIKDYLTGELEKVFDNLGYDKSYAKVSFSDREDIAHLQCNGAFGIAKAEHTNPMLIADKIVSNLSHLNDKFDISVAKPAFINFLIKDEYFDQIASDFALSPRAGVDIQNKTDFVVLDFGGANVAKPLHVGHLRSAVIGEALRRLNIFMGNTVIGDVHLGDWGLQMGLTIAQLMDDYDMSGYFDSSKPKTAITESMLEIAYPKASARKKEDEEFANRASDITLWLQNKKPGYYDIWQELRKVSVDMVKRTYDRLGVAFDLWNGESSVNELVPVVVDKLKKQKLAYISEGALVVDVENYTNQPMPPAIILKSNGAQMYIITDIATIVERAHNYPKLSRIVYITDARQALHFKQVFGVTRQAKLVGDNVSLEHYGFGTVNGKDGKPFKTRDGGTMKLDDLIDMVTAKAHDRLMENGSKENKDLAYTIAMAAIKYGDLSNQISRDYIFDEDKFTTFEGKTGPYLQYTAVRIKSLLNKASFDGKANIKITLPEERKILFSILKLNESYFTCMADNSLNTLCAELYNVASAYSNFYNNIKILTESDEDKKRSYLMLSKLTLNALTIGLNVLGIDVPEYM